MAGTNNYGPYYDNIGVSYINPWGFSVSGVDSPLNTNVEETAPNPPAIPPPPPPPPPIVLSSTTDITAPAIGTFTLVTGEFISGDLVNGGTLGLGGTVEISVPDGGISYTATVNSGAPWGLVTLANGTHTYILTCFLSSDQGGGVFDLETANVGLGLWPGEAAVSFLSIFLNNFGDIFGSSGIISG